MYPRIRKMGGDVLAVSVDPISMSRSAARHLKLDFPIVTDRDHQLGSAFKDFHVVTASMNMGPVDNHAVFVLDGRGVLRWKDMEPDTMNVDDSAILHAVEAVGRA
jgi:peroxiredoxin